jgi:preprotein translocase subunit YajC
MKAERIKRRNKCKQISGMVQKMVARDLVPDEEPVTVATEKSTMSVQKKTVASVKTQNSEVDVGGGTKFKIPKETFEEKLPAGVTEVTINAQSTKENPYEDSQIQISGDEAGTKYTQVGEVVQELVLTDQNGTEIRIENTNKPIEIVSTPRTGFTPNDTVKVSTTYYNTNNDKWETTGLTEPVYRDGKFISYSTHLTLFSLVSKTLVSSTADPIADKTGADGAIVGIVVGVFFAILAMIAVWYFFFREPDKRATSQVSSAQHSEMGNLAVNSRRVNEVELV